MILISMTLLLVHAQICFYYNVTSCIQKWLDFSFPYIESESHLKCANLELAIYKLIFCVVDTVEDLWQGERR